MKENSKFGGDKENSKIDKVAEYATQKSVNFEKESRATQGANIGRQKLG